MAVAPCAGRMQKHAPVAQPHGVACPGYTDLARSASVRRRQSSPNAAAATIAAATAAAAAQKSASESSPATSRRGSETSLGDATLAPSPTRRSHAVEVAASLSQGQVAAWARALRLSSSDTGLLAQFCKAVQSVPSTSFSTEQAIWTDIILPALPHSLEAGRALLFTLLSYSASHMAFLTHMPVYSRAANVHRGDALQLLQGDLQGDADLDQAPAGATQLSAANCAIGAAILLADQAALEGDWRANTLHLRGVHNLATHALRSRSPRVGTASEASHQVSHFARARAALPVDVRERATFQLDFGAMWRCADGRSCLQQLLAMQVFFTQQESLFQPHPQAYAGNRLDLSNTVQKQHFECAYGGVGHLLAVACQVHNFRERLATFVEMPSSAQSNEAALLEEQLQSLMLLLQHWIVSVPKQVMHAAFAEDQACCLLFVYKSALDLVLYRALLLLNPHLATPREPIRTSPNVVLANDFIGTFKHSAPQSPLSAHRAWLSWPLWVHSWSSAYTDPAAIQAELADERRRSSASLSFASSLESVASAVSLASSSGYLQPFAQETKGPPVVSLVAMPSQRLHPALAEIEEGVAMPDHAFFQPIEEELSLYTEL